MTKRLYSIDAPDQARLKIARTEIEAVLKKHDLAGAVVLHTPGMSEFFYDIQPSYSCVRIDEAVETVHVKSKLSDYRGDVVAQRLDQAASANMLRCLRDNMHSASLMFGYAGQYLDSVALTTHTEGVHTPEPMEARKQ